MDPVSPQSSLSMEELDIIDLAIKELVNAKVQRARAEVLLSEALVLRIVRSAKQVFLRQPMLLELRAPVNICGDIHGQFSDLLRIFEICGFPPHANYLFLGDYVDRARQGVETLTLLLCYKLKYPNTVFLLRGNHECSSLNRIYGFYDECKRRYSVRLWKAFVDCFNCLPVAAVVDNSIFCVHGGLSPDLQKLSQINSIKRPVEIPDDGVLCDLLWSDPTADNSGWGFSMRGVSYSFGFDVATQFLESNSLQLLCRAHQVVEDGYEFLNKRQIVTVFSAPNYCGEFDNAGGVLIVSEDLRCSFQLLRPISHKYWHCKADDTRAPKPV